MDRIVRVPLLRAALGVAISVLALAVVAGSVDLDATARVLGAAAPSWVLVAGAFFLGDVLVRGLRWRQLLAPVAFVRLHRVLG